MKAISLHQPWASMIADGWKTIETRSWPTDYRGDLLICSTKKPIIQNFPLGMALCIVRVVSCRRMMKFDEFKACCPIYDGAYSWFLDDLREIEPFPVKGSQGFFEVDMNIPVKKEICYPSGQEGLFE